MAIVLTSILVLSAAVLSFDSARSVSACPSTNSAKLVSWSVNQDGAGGFSFFVSATWKTVSKPLIGVIEQATGTVDVGVKDVSYTPSYWFPKSCESGLPIFVQGKKTDAKLHVVRSIVTLGPGSPSVKAALSTSIP